jgi:hypothetical protein
MYFMSDVKQKRFSSLLAEERAPHRGAGNATADVNAPRLDVKAPRAPTAPPNGNGKEVTSWDAYRNWLTKVQAPEQKRSLPDPALFSFKGYRSWAEKIRRDWDTEE